MLIPEDQYPDEAIVNVVIIGGKFIFVFASIFFLLLWLMILVMIKIVEVN
jgi:hypothetical protein